MLTLKQIREVFFSLLLQSNMKETQLDNIDKIQDLKKTTILLNKNDKDIDAKYAQKTEKME